MAEVVPLVRLKGGEKASGLLGLPLTFVSLSRQLLGQCESGHFPLPVTDRAFASSARGIPTGKPYLIQPKGNDCTHMRKNVSYSRKPHFVSIIPIAQNYTQITVVQGYL